RIYVIGTCVGRFVTNGDIDIVGRSPAESRIRAIGSSALKVYGPGRSTILNLTLFDSNSGLEVEGQGRSAAVAGCEITGNFNGVIAWNGATVALQNSHVHSNDAAGVSGDDVRVYVFASVISDNYNGVYLNSNSTLDLQSTEVRGNRS